MLRMCSFPESGLHQHTSIGDSAASTSFMAATGTVFTLFASSRPIRFIVSMSSTMPVEIPRDRSHRWRL